MISITQKGSFDHTEAYLRKLTGDPLFAVVSKYGLIGVNALSNATPVDTGETAGSWYFTVERGPGHYAVIWRNRHIDDEGQMIAILLQYGHGTGTGGYVQGRDYINPAMQPVFDDMINDFVREVKNL